MNNLDQNHYRGFSIVEVLGGLSIVAMGLASFFVVMSSLLKTLRLEARELEVSAALATQLKNAYAFRDERLIEKIENELNLEGFSLRKGKLEDLHWEFFLPIENTWEILEHDVYGYELCDSSGKIILVIPEGILYEAFRS